MCFQVDVFPIDLGTTSMGSIHLIDIGFATKQSLAGSMSAGKDWYLSSVTVQDMDTKNTNTFFYEDWITKSKPRAQLQPHKPSAGGPNSTPKVSWHFLPAADYFPAYRPLFLFAIIDFERTCLAMPAIYPPCDVEQHERLALLCVKCRCAVLATLPCLLA